MHVLTIIGMPRQCNDFFIPNRSQIGNIAKSPIRPPISTMETTKAASSIFSPLTGYSDV